MIGVDIQEDRATVSRFLQERGLSFSTVLDPEGEVAAQYGVRGIPSVFLIDREGVVRFQGYQLPSQEEIAKVL